MRTKGSFLILSGRVVGVQGGDLLVTGRLLDPADGRAPSVTFRLQGVRTDLFQKVSDLLAQGRTPWIAFSPRRAWRDEPATLVVEPSATHLIRT